MATDYGSDISTVGGLDRTFTPVTDPVRVVGERLIRRLSTPRGSMPWAPGAGYDLRGRLNAAFDASTLAAEASRIEGECELDEAVERARATVLFDRATMTLSVTIEVEGAEGPFTLVLSVDALSISLLQVVT